MQKVFTSFAEIEKFDRLVDEIDAKFDPFRDVIGSYFLQTEIRCSKKDCHQSHKQGAVVELASGKVSYIGHRCAKNEFGENFEIAWEAHKERILLPQLRAELTSFKANLSKVQTRIRLLSEAIPQRSQLLAKFVHFFPYLTQDLRRRSAEGNSRVMTERERTAQEIEQMLSLNSRLSAVSVRYESVVAGSLQGLAIFQDRQIHGLLQSLDAGCQNLTIANPYLLPKKEVFSMHRWTREADHGMSSLGQWVSDADRFFSEDNFRVLKMINGSGPLQSEVARVGLQELRHLQLHAVNQELVKKVEERPKIAVGTDVASGSDRRHSAGMRAFQRLMSGKKD